MTIYVTMIVFSAINMLKDKAPGTFVVRDSNSFPGAFGLALKVASPPPGVQPKSGTFLLTRTSLGREMTGGRNARSVIACVQKWANC